MSALFEMKLNHEIIELSCGLSSLVITRVRGSRGCVSAWVHWWFGSKSYMGPVGRVVLQNFAWVNKVLAWV